MMKPGVVLLPFRTASAALSDWLAFYLMRRPELVDRWKWVGDCFLRLLHDSLVTENGCSGNDGGQFVLGYKKLEFLLFLGGNLCAV